MRFVRVLKAYNEDCENIIELMLDENIPTREASPNFVADFAWNHGYEDLSSNEIVWISDNYENTNYKNSKKSKLLKASNWKVEKISETDWVIKSPDGTYKNSDGKDYHFKTKEDALEELDYLRAEHKFDKKSKKVKSSVDPFEIANNIIDLVEPELRMYLDVELQYDIDEDDRTISFWHHPEDITEGSISSDNRKEIRQLIERATKSQECFLVSIDIYKYEVSFIIEY